MERTIEIRVTVQETKEPVPDVLAVALGRHPSFPQGLRRLGTALTDGEGQAKIQYEIVDSLSPEVSLSIALCGPEGPERATEPLYRTPSAAERLHPADCESFFVRLPRAALDDAGLDTEPLEPTASGRATTVVNRLHNALNHQTEVATGARSLAAVHVGESRARLNSMESSIRAQLQAGVQGPPPVIEMRAVGRCVNPEDSVTQATRDAFQRGLNGQVSGRLSIGAIALPADAPDAPTSEYIEDLIFGRYLADGESVSLAISESASLTCHEQLRPEDGCCDEAGDEPIPVNAPSAPTSGFGWRTGPSPSTPDGVPHDGESPPVNDDEHHQHIVTRALELVERTGELGSIDERPGAVDIAENIAAMSLRSGPADSTSVFDFDVLSIAFEHVWREAFDEDVIDTAMELYSEIVLLGGEPPVRRLPPQMYMRALRAEVRALAQTTPMRPAAGVATVRPRGRIRDHRGETRPRPTRPRPPRGNGTSAPRPRGGSGTPPVRPSAGRPSALLRELEERLQEPYSFTSYAVQNGEHAINFGLVTTYRQRWQPLEYQAGDLVKTITLAPKEELSYSRKTTRKRTRRESSKRSIDELERSDETHMRRDADDIVRGARASLGMDVSGTYKAISGGIQGSSEKSSSETKRRIREAVRKASQELKESRSLEITVTDEGTIATEESGKLINPNDELPVTYLFYELQRRYRVSERIHRLTPVILVAQPMPSPHEITRSWILQHDWILESGILDSSFLPAIDYLRTSSEGAEMYVDELYQNLILQRQLVTTLEGQRRTRLQETRDRYSALAEAIARARRAEGEAATEGYIEKGLEWIIGSNDVDPESARLVEEASRDAYERALADQQSLEERLLREQEIVTTATERYLEALRVFKNRELAVMRLRVHIKQNILHYMRLIWDHEDPDQRFFRLHNVRVPRIVGSLHYQVVDDPDGLPQPPSWRTPKKLLATAQLDPVKGDVALVEIADLDNPLGYKGNYLILPLRQANVLTRYMMVPYADAAAGLRDPDTLGNYTRSELETYVCCLKKRLGEQEFAELRPLINQLYARLLSDTRRDEEEVVVPTGSLFIEALPGTHPILEDFKLRHRAIDVVAAATEVRRKELENLRYAARIVAGELDDPDIDKLIHIDGQGHIVTGE